MQHIYFVAGDIVKKGLTSAILAQKIKTRDTIMSNKCVDQNTMMLCKLVQTYALAYNKTDSAAFVLGLLLNYLCDF